LINFGFHFVYPIILYGSNGVHQWDNHFGAWDNFLLKAILGIGAIFACYINATKLTIKPFSAGSLPIMALDAKKLIFYKNAYSI
jgi:hypothetical protein